MSFLATFPACSLILDRRADQCSTDEECARFPGTKCETKQRVCVVVADMVDGGNPQPMNDSGAKGDEAAAPLQPDSAVDVAVEAFVDPCVGPNGCYACAPVSPFQFANGCTNAECKPFDNRTRLKSLFPDGGFAPLPPPRDAGGQ
jgi:hypothetical protein